jgi:PTS system nitrogen regulatory IIA component
MELSVRDAARIFKVSESTIYRWIKEGDLPSRDIDGEHRFNRAEILEWATVNKVAPAGDLFEEAPASTLLLYESLRAGGITRRAAAASKQAVLHDIVKDLPLPADADREALLALFAAREKLGSTAVGSGIAIPHPRHPIILPLGQPLLHLCFLDQPIDFGAADREPVHALFVLMCPTIRLHLQMLARIARLLRDDAFQRLLRDRAPAEEILVRIRRIEEQLASKPAEN